MQTDEKDELTLQRRYYKRWSPAHPEIEKWRDFMGDKFSYYIEKEVLHLSDKTFLLYKLVPGEVLLIEVYEGGSTMYTVYNPFDFKALMERESFNEC